VHFRLRRVLSLARRLAVARALATTIHVNTTCPAIALTFDDGPHPDITPEVLKILDRYDARATFFMVGELAAQHRHLVDKVAASGHAIANHSWDHTSFPTLNHWQRVNQIRATARILAPYEVKIFRPPFGDQNGRSAIAARLLGYQTIAWSGDAGDWLPHTAEEMLDRLMKQARAGSILLLHDGLVRLHGSEPPRTHMLTALTAFLERMQDFQFVTLPQLFRLGTLRQQPWYQIKQSGGGPNFWRTW